MDQFGQLAEITIIIKIIIIILINNSNNNNNNNHHNNNVPDSEGTNSADLEGRFRHHIAIYTGNIMLLSAHVKAVFLKNKSLLK